MKGRRHIVFLGLLALVVGLVVGCRPRGVISSRQMRHVLVDLHKTDALLQVYGYRYGHDSIEDAYYAAVLQKHGLTQAQFDSSLVWYTNNPQLFDKIYPKVLADLAEEKAAFEAEHADELKPSLDDEFPRIERPKMSREEAKMQMDSLFWVIRQGPPTSWNEVWHRPIPDPKIPYLQ